jgi:hypothetical protein
MPLTMRPTGQALRLFLYGPGEGEKFKISAEIWARHWEACLAQAAAADRRTHYRLGRSRWPIIPMMNGPIRANGAGDQGEEMVTPRALEVLTGSARSQIVYQIQRCKRFRPNRNIQSTARNISCLPLRVA